MNILDENVPRDQADLLAQWGIRCRSISRDLGYQGIHDEDILPLLLRVKAPTLFTRDQDFFRREHIHQGYCLVWFDVASEETAFFIRRFLNHPLFGTKARRMGKVVHVQPGSVEYWQRHSNALVVAEWARRA